MRAHFVDTLLARLDGEVACIWVTIAVTVDRPPAIDELRAQVVAAYRATPRLRRVWSDRETRWRDVERSDAELGATVAIESEPATRAAIIADAIARRIDLARDPTFYVGVHRLVGGATLLTFQLHHAVGDARALGNLLDRLFRGARQPPGRRKGPAMSDDNVIAGAILTPRATARLLRARHRMLAARGVALPRDGDAIGAPLVASVRVAVAGGAREHAALFYGAVAAVAARWSRAPHGRVRLRVPVDLASRFVFEDQVANTCITVPLELDVAALRAAPEAAAGYVSERLASTLERGAVWPALLEALLVARLASRRRLRAGARPGLLAERRTNTLVATYVGALDRYFAAAPFEVTGAVGHTPTWGANGFTLGADLVVNVSAFSGLWRPETAARFRDDVAAWLIEHADASIVEVGP